MKKNIIIEGHKSDWYEKAIFILKDSKTTQIPKNLVAHADDILEKKLKIGEYTANSINLDKYAAFDKNSSKEKEPSRSNWMDNFFGVSLGILGISIIFYFLF